jgi:toxin ParE1/3/4
VARFELARRAQADLDAISTYTTDQWGAPQTQKYLQALEARMLQLAGRPLLGHQRVDLAEGILSFPIESHVIYYARATFGIVVLRVLHKRQDPYRHLGLAQP